MFASQSFSQYSTETRPYSVRSGTHTVSGSLESNLNLVLHADEYIEAAVDSVPRSDLSETEKLKKRIFLFILRGAMGYTSSGRNVLALNPEYCLPMLKMMVSHIFEEGNGEVQRADCMPNNCMLII